MKIAILGAGVSGLSLARFLVEGGLALADVHLFEAAPVVGGLCRSKEVEGFTYDVAGGHILYSKDRAAMDWMMDCAGGERAFERRERHTQDPLRRALRALPLRERARRPAAAGQLRVPQGLRRRLARAGRPARPPAPASFGAWVRWRFGAGIAEHFMDPYNQKVWKRELDFLSSDWVAGRVPDAPIDDVLRASIGIRTEGYTHQASFYYPARGGFQAITDGIAAAVLGRVRLSTPVGSLVSSKGSSKGSWRVDGETFDLVVSTLPLTDLPDLVPRDARRRGRGDAHARVQRADVGARGPRPPRAPRPLLGLPAAPRAGPGEPRHLHVELLAASNAPAGKSSLLCEVTHPGRSPEAGPELEREIEDGLVHAGLIQRGEVLFTDRASVEHAYVVFDHDYAARRAAGARLDDRGRPRPARSLRPLRVRQLRPVRDQVPRAGGGAPGAGRGGLTGRPRGPTKIEPLSRG